MVAMVCSAPDLKGWHTRSWGMIHVVLERYILWLCNKRIIFNTMVKTTLNDLTLRHLIALDNLSLRSICQVLEAYSAMISLLHSDL